MDIFRILLYNDTSVKSSKSRSCLHDKAFELRHAKYEKVAIYAVNQRISNILRIAEAA